MELLPAMEFHLPGPHKFARPEAGMTGGGQRVAKRFTRCSVFGAGTVMTESANNANAMTQQKIVLNARLISKALA
jgi:hypothetical protein